MSRWNGRCRSGLLTGTTRKYKNQGQQDGFEGVDDVFVHDPCILKLVSRREWRKKDIQKRKTAGQSCLANPNGAIRPTMFSYLAYYKGGWSKFVRLNMKTSLIRNRSASNQQFATRG